MQTNIQAVTSVDGKFQFLLDKSSQEFFVTMNTFGLPKRVEGVLNGPYGVFSSKDSSIQGEPKLDGGTVYTFNGSDWESASDTSSPGVFIVR